MLKSTNLFLKWKVQNDRTYKARKKMIARMEAHQIGLTIELDEVAIQTIQDEAQREKKKINRASSTLTYMESQEKRGIKWRI